MKKRNDLKESLKREAEERNRNWAGLTTQQKIDELDKRLGKGVGAKKQRAKLSKLLES